MKEDRKMISFNDIGKYSDWPSRLLSNNEFSFRKKTTSEVIREFDKDKWGNLLSKLNTKKSFKFDDVEIMERDQNELIPCFDKEVGFYLTTIKRAEQRLLKLYQETIQTHLKNASCLVEFGAGYGSKIIKLSDALEINGLKLFAAEYTNSGCELIKLISGMLNKQISVGKCDFNSMTLEGIDIPENSIIFTSYALHYTQKLNTGIVDYFFKFNPKAVIHFEPCYEYLDKRTIHGMMSRRYIEMNDYTKNIASSLDDGCKKNNLEFKVNKNIFGSNPFLPISVIECLP